MQAFFSEAIQRIPEPDRRRGLTFAGRGRCHGRDQDQLPIRTPGETIDIVQRYLGFVVAIGFEVLIRDPEAVAGDIDDALEFCRLGDFDVRSHASPPMIYGRVIGARPIFCRDSDLTGYYYPRRGNSNVDPRIVHSFGLREFPPNTSRLALAPTARTIRA